LKYNKLLGQHFIYDEDLLKKIVNTAGNITNYNVLEIGGGIGTLTRTILESKPISLTTIEKDIRFKDQHDNLKKNYDNYQYITDDVFNYKIHDIIPKPAIIIANLPYNISSVLLLKLLEQINHFEFLVLMFQKEVAQRITAKPRTKSYGTLSVLTQILCDVNYEFEVSPESFVPQPKVQSAVVKITPYKEQKYEFNDLSLKEILKIGFSQRRKMIKSSLWTIFKNEQEMQRIFKICDINETSRLEELNIAKMAELSLLIHIR
jgi:16S rRNA (adenine1518-N6/adenine1519-N6)-dimethyltransferase